MPKLRDVWLVKLAYRVIAVSADLVNLWPCLAGLLTLLALVDFYFIKKAYLSTLLHGASAQLVFGF